MDNITAALLLYSIDDINSKRFKELIDNFNEPKNVFNASEKELKKINNITSKIIYKIQRAKLSAEISDILETCKKHNFNIIYYGAKDYPENLANLEMPPPILYTTQNLIAKDNNAVAVIGSRFACKYAVGVTENFTEKLCNCGFTIVSGFAKGIDICAHNTAVKSNGRTICVLGTGLMRKCIYPAEHRYFYDKFLENPNVVFLTEYPPNTIAAKQNFPARNRIISGLSLGVLVVQAGKKSGALITAEMALEQNREVFAIPDRIGSINSFGTNELIKLGKAKLTQSVDDILDELRPDYSEFNTVEQVSIATKKLKLSEFEEKVLNTLTPLPRKLSDLADALDMPEHNLAAVLTKLELKNLVRQLPGHLYCIK